MKALSNLLMVALLATLVFGCATSGQKFSAMKDSVPELSGENGRIYVYRTSALGAAIQPKVMINGTEAGKSVPKGFFYVDEPAGNYEISTTTEVKRNLSLTLEKGQTRFVRLNVSMGFFAGHVYPELIDNQTAMSEMKDCHYLGNK